MRKLVTFGAVGLASVLSLATARAQGAGQAPQPIDQPSTGTQIRGQGLSAQDRAFVMKAASAGLAEVELGRIALDRAQSNEVKQFARRMVDDHQKANDELKSIATEEGLTLPTELDSQHKAIRDRLSALSGAEFDKAYMDAMMKDHEQAVNLFAKQSKEGQNVRLKEFATSTLPTLRQHKGMVHTDEGMLKK